MNRSNFYTLQEHYERRDESENSHVKEEYFGDGCKRFSENDCIEAVEKKLTIDDDLTHIERAHGYLESLFKVVDSPCLDRVPGGQTDPLLE